MKRIRRTRATENAKAARRSRREPRTTSPAGRRVAGFVLVAAALVAVLSLVVSSSVRVNGTRVPIGREWTVADCGRFMQLRVDTGDLLDVEGEVLLKRAGNPARAWRGDARVELTAYVERGDRLRIAPATDTTEPIIDEVEYVSARCRSKAGKLLPQTDSLPFVRGIKRTRRGTYSKKLVSSEVAYASAVVYESNPAARPKCVAFTYDDGPNDTWTPNFLEVFRDHGARATFFVLGQAIKSRSEIFRQTIAQGNEVGCHSWSHRNFTHLSNEAARNDLERCLKVMKEEGAREVRLFRPPYGAYSKRVESVVNSLGMRIAMWDVDPADWRRPGADVIYSRVMSGVKDGAVVLMHDGPAKREQTLAATKRLLKTLQAQGYQFVTMSEATGLVPIFTGEVVLKVGEREYHLTPMPRDLRVEVNGIPLRLSMSPLRTDGDILVPAREVVTALGCKVEYAKRTETLTVQCPGHVAVFRLDSLSCELDGEGITLSVPPVLYRGRAFAPLSVLKRICGVSCVLDEVRHILIINTLESAHLNIGPA